MNPEQTKKHPHTTKEADEKNAKRREIYRDMPLAEKNALLLLRRVKNRQITTARLLANTNSTNPVESPRISPDNINVECSSSVSQVSGCNVVVLTSVPQQGKEIIRFSRVFEKGETSGSSNEPHAVSFKKVLPSGNVKNKRNMTNLILLRSDYIPLKKIPNCEFCLAKKFEYESAGFCCASGTIKLTSHRMPVALKNLYIGTSEKSQHFQTYIRTYNNLFAFTSFGVSYDKDLAKRNHGIYTFRVQGKMYHFIDDLYPSERGPRNLQLYFYDNDNEVTNRMACSDKVDELIVKELMGILKDNPYSIFLRTLSEIPVYKTIISPSNVTLDWINEFSTYQVLLKLQQYG